MNKKGPGHQHETEAPYNTIAYLVMGFLKSRASTPVFARKINLPRLGSRLDLYKSSIAKCLGILEVETKINSLDLISK